MSDPTFEQLHDQLAADPERPLSLLDRRRFLQGALIAGGALVVPTAFADYAGAQSSPNTVVLTITLGGGNDGLNTFGAFSNGRYRDARGRLAINPANAHSVEGALSFHPNLSRLAARYRRGDVAVVSGVGEPQRDLSHFSNMARWQSANPSGRITGTGWLGRWLDTSNSTAFSGVAVGGSGVPLHFRGADSDVTDLPSSGGNALFGSQTTDGRDRRLYTAIRSMENDPSRSAWANRVGEVNALSIRTAQEVAPAFARELPEGELANDLVLAARVINLNLGTRMLNVWHGGYDLHDNQVGANSGVGDHADLLQELDAGIDVFFRTLNARLVERVVVIVYSEFGRRVEANGSNGTDHGTSSHLFAIGDRVAGGLYGEIPPLNALDDRGNLRVTTDFRRAYATVLEDALGSPSQPILGAAYPTIDFLTAGSNTSTPATGSAAQRIRDRREDRLEDYLIEHSATS